MDTVTLHSWKHDAMAVCDVCAEVLRVAEAQHVILDGESASSGAAGCPLDVAVCRCTSLPAAAAAAADTENKPRSPTPMSAPPVSLEARAAAFMRHVGGNLRALIPADAGASSASAAAMTRAAFQTTLAGVIEAGVTHAALRQHLLARIAEYAAPLWERYACACVCCVCMGLRIRAHAAIFSVC
jgi:hypothetical protein